MEKEFEALKRLYLTRCSNKTADKDYKLLQQALTELKAIKEAKPSEAIMELEVIKDILNEFVKNDLIDKAFNTIKQALIKAQEQEKVLEILFKYFDIKVVTSTESAFSCITIQRKGCNQMLHQAQKTTFKKEEQEEFDLLKRWCEK